MSDLIKWGYRCQYQNIRIFFQNLAGERFPVMVRVESVPPTLSPLQAEEG